MAIHPVAVESFSPDQSAGQVDIYEAMLLTWLKINTFLYNILCSSCLIGYVLSKIQHILELSGCLSYRLKVSITAPQSCPHSLPRLKMHL